MTFDPVFLASTRTDEELLERIDNRQKYMPETIAASLDELQRRGKAFTEEEVRIINEDINAQLANAQNPDGSASFFRSENSAVVEDPDAPALFSKRIIYIFTVLTSPLFGSIMMAMNISKTKNKQGVAAVVLFGFAFTFLGIFLISRINAPQSLVIVMGIAAGYILNFYFWNKYIGNTTFYRVRKAWGVLIIALALIALYIVMYQSALTAGVK